MLKVIGRPETEYRYEFEVAKHIYKELYLHEGYFTNGFEAEQKAIEVGGIIIHDVRVAHKERIE